MINKPNEKIIKSRRRVKEYAEVYTPSRVVKDMCDVLPCGVWEDIARSFLEPACGNGNILVEVLQRKLERCSSEAEGLTALSSIYGIDILADNAEEARQRLYGLFARRFAEASEDTLGKARALLRANIICGDSLKILDKNEENTK